MRYFLYKSCRCPNVNNCGFDYYYLGTTIGISPDNNGYAFTLNKTSKINILLSTEIVIVIDDIWHGLLFIILRVLKTKSVSLTIVANVNTNLTDSIIYTMLNNITM